jgi:peptide/nickel transport system substrate-binding protein
MAEDEERYYRAFDKFFGRWSRRDFLKRAGSSLVFTAFTGSILEFLAACTGGGTTTGGAGQTPVKGGTLREGSPIDLTGNFNTIRVGFYSTDGFIPAMIYDGLLQLHKDTGDVQPLLAEALPSVSSDNTTYSFKLRKDAVWTDGKPLTADDVVFTYQLMYDPAWKTVISNHRPDLQARLKSVTAPDPYTVVMQTNGPWASFLAYHGRYGILPKHVVGNFTPDQMNTSPYWAAPTTTCGPFKFVEWVKADHVTLARNDKYWGDKSNIDTYIHKTIPQLTALVDQLKTGELDCTRLFNPPVIASLEAAGVKSTPVPSPQIAYLGFQQDPTKGPANLFSDPNVRKALMMAVDRAGIINAVFSNLGAKALDQHWTPENWAHDSAYSDKYKYDPKTAADMLDAAGWKKGSDGVRQKDGARMAFSMPISIVWQDVTNAMAAGWKQIGVDVTVVQISFAQAFQQFTFGHQGSIGPNIILQAYDSDISNFFTSANAAVGGNNASNYRDATLDGLFKQATSTLDRSKASAVYRQIEQYFLDTSLAPAMWQYIYFWSQNGRVHNAVDGPDHVIGTWAFNDPRKMHKLWVTAT